MTASETPGATGGLTPSPPPPEPPRRLHPVTPVFDLIAGMRQLWPLALALVFGRAEATQLITGTLLVLLLASRMLRWLRTYYQLAPSALVFESGILSRRRRTVPYDRVQQVNVVRKLRHRVLGVAALRIETAGGQGPEISLDVLGLDEADRLRRRLTPVGAPAGHPVAPTAVAVGQRAPTAEPTGPSPPQAQDEQQAAQQEPLDEVLVRVPIGDLVIAGVTGAKLVAVLGGLAALQRAFDELPGNVTDRLADIEIPALSVAAAALAVLVATALWFGVAALVSVMTDYDFTLRRSGDRYVATRGLLERREVGLPVHRVQVVVIEQSPLRRMLGVASVRIQSAAGRVTVPLMREAAAVRLAEQLAGTRSLPDLHPAPRAARRRAVVRRVLPAAAATAAAAVLVGPVGLLALLTVPLAALLGVLAWRGLGHGIDDRVVVGRRGAVARSLTVAPVDKAQSTRVQSTPFQRRAGLATLHVDLAGGPPATLPELAAPMAGNLARSLVRPTPARRADDRRYRSGEPPRGRR